MIDIYKMATIFQFFHNGQMLIFHFHQHSENQRPKLWGGGSVIWNVSIWLIFTKWWPFLIFFIISNADILFQLILRKPEMPIFCMAKLKTFMGGEFSALWKMGDTNFPLVHFSKFSIDSVFQIFCWFSFPSHCILGSFSKFMCGWNIYA